MLPAAVLFDSSDAVLPRAAPEEVGIDRPALDALVRECEETRSDSLIVIKDGRLVAERYFGNPRTPIETMSITKSVVSLAVGMLIAEGRIASLDAPVSTWFPEWKKGLKAKVTLRHVLTHTTGLEQKKSLNGLNASKDRLQFARSLKVVDEPGTVYHYSNEGSMLLSGIIKQAARRPVDAYLSEKLFKPLGITGWSWAQDAAHNVPTYYGLALQARDLARIGMLLLAEGQWEGREVVPASWIQQTGAPGPVNPNYGLSWHVRYDGTVRVTTSKSIELLRGAGFSGAESLRPLVDRPRPSEEAWWMEAGALLGPNDRNALAALKDAGAEPYETRPGRRLGFSADGSLGQKLGVYPEVKLVAVRQHKRIGNVEDENQKYGFAAFHERVARLVLR